MTIQEQMNAWIMPGHLGFYQSCELNVCGLLDHDGNLHNLFTLVVFESRKLKECPAKVYLTQRNERFGNGIRLLVEQSHISVDDAIALCSQLQMRCNRLQLESGVLTISTLTPVPATFVPADSTKNIPLNRVLKNNFCGGSMVAEWSGNSDTIDKLISGEDLQRVALRIRELLPLDLFTISDRIGNIIFQLPAQVAFCEFYGSKREAKFIVRFDARIQNTTQYLLSVMTDHDSTLVGFRTFESGQGEFEVTVEATGGPYIINLLDTRQGIPVFHRTVSTVQVIDQIITAQGNLNSMRTVALPGQDEKQVQINSSVRNTVGHPAPFWKEAAVQRRYQRRMFELTRSREFIRYGKGSNDRQRALDDIRALMNVGPDTQVCLWDPYLCAADLLETWYYTDTYGLELRAITSNEISKQKKMLFDDWRAEQRRVLRAGSNQYGINLIWRAQHDTFGFSFHDRFLIQLPPDGEPKVWSLGISVNGFGKSHHILQLVSNPGYIVDAFEELWNALDNPSCQIWNSREEL